MKKKQLKKLKQHVKKHRPAPYIAQLTQYGELFDSFPAIKYLVNNVLEADRLLKRGLIPQALPKLLLPDDIQDQIFAAVNAQYPRGDRQGDRLWEQYSNALPKLDQLLRNFRDYLETTYGMWSYTNTSFISALSDYLAGAPVLEIMAGNGYLSKGLRDHNPLQTIFTTDSQAWVKENQTGKHPVTTIEALDALAAIEKYGDQVDYVLMSWAPDKDENDYQVLELLRKRFPDVRLLVIGERDGATNSPKFWHLAQLSQPAALAPVNAGLKSFDLIDEQVYLAK